jgi:hypothetical protein
MSRPTRLRPDAVLQGYVHAKGANRPHLLREVFAADADLQVSTQSGTIALPPATHGREAIAEVLVRRFAQTYENIYTFYMACPPGEATQFACDWLVGMSEKAGQHVRVGCGRYDWTFQTELPGLACQLAITIHAMPVLPPSQFDPVFAWLRQLHYPWSSAVAATTLAPHVAMLAPVLQYLGRTGGGA